MQQMLFNDDPLRMRYKQEIITNVELNHLLNENRLSRMGQDRVTV